MEALVNAAAGIPIPPALQSFVGLSYPVPPPDDIDSYYDATYYTKGPKDLLFVATWVVLLAFFRELLMRFFFMPIARSRFASLAAAKRNARPTSPNGAPARLKPNGQTVSEKIAASPQDSSMKSVRQRSSRRSSPTSKANKPVKSWTETKKDRDAKLLERNIVRFAEQGWSLAYYTVFWALGVSIYINLPCFPLQTKHFWINYPVRFLPGPIKFYYLCQLSCWVHQLVVLNIEARRKDHYQMLAHHIITISLIVGSYIMHLTRVGIAILVIMDFCDIILPLAKMLLYLRLPSILPDTVFGLFVVSWLVTRQGAFTLVVWSVIKETPIYLPNDFRPMDGQFWSVPTYWGFVIFLVGLLGILWVWFWMICRVAYGVIVGKPAEDTRSDEEDLASSSSATLALNSPSGSDSDTLAGGSSQAATPPKSPKKQ
ncbi:sphingosine N-acyltransferase lag1 [Ceratobasidium sp. 414]|nr:sphingosine N-acyltransferase lag1 [Ceratobasidium sp. 414]